MTEWLHFHFSLSCIGEGNGNPLQCSCLETPRDGGAWWAAVYGVAQSQTQLKCLSTSSSSCPVRPTLGSGCPLWDPACLSSGPQTELCFLHFSHVLALYMLVIPIETVLHSHLGNTDKSYTSWHVQAPSLLLLQKLRTCRPILTSVLLAVPHHTVCLQFSFL